MVWPFKWNLSTCTYTWCYLFFKILRNEIWDFLLNFTFGHIWQWQGKNRTMWYVNTNLHCHQCSIFIKLKFACLQIFIELLQKWNKKDLKWKNLRIKKIQPLWHYRATEIKCHYSDGNYLRWDSWQATPNMNLVLIQMLLLKNS